MQPEQIAKLEGLMGRLTDVVLQDADPDTWVASGTALKDMTKAERGDAAWCRKTASLSVTVLLQVQRLHALATVGTAPGEGEPSEADQLADAEAKAQAMIERVARAGAASK